MANFGLPTPATGTDAELLAILRKQYAYTLEYGHDRQENGRRVVGLTAAQLLEQIEKLEAKVEAAANPGGLAVTYVKRLPPV